MKLKVCNIILGFLMLSLLPVIAEAQMVNKVITGHYVSKNPNEARTKILEQATSQVTEEIIVRLIGDIKYKKNRTLILGRIQSQAGRYIPTLKTSAITPEGDGFKMVVDMQVMPNVLEQMLLENGLLYDSEGNPVITPMITFESDKGQNIWWMENSDPSLISFQTQFERMLQKRFFESGFFLERPAHSRWGDIFPIDFKRSRLSTEDLQNLGPKLGSQIFLTGKVKISPSVEKSGSYRIDISLQAIQSSNGRLVAEIVRNLSTDHGELETILVSRRFLTSVDVVLKDVSAQVLEAWQRGTFGSTVAEIQVQGKVGPNQYEAIKEAFRNKSRLIRQLRERRVAQDGVTFEADISGPIDQVAESLKELTIGSSRFKIKSVLANKIIVEKL